MNYHLVTLGCQMNMADSERVGTILNDMGYTYTPNEKEAQIIGILACSVRQKSIHKVYFRIHQWNKWKNERTLLTFITGCILEKDWVKFLKLFDIVFQIKDVQKLPSMIGQYGITIPKTYTSYFDVRNIGIDKFWEIIPTYSSKFEAFVPIQNGCDKLCNFCAVPYTRGREVSRKSDDILNEVEELIQKGYKSITLLGQNVNSYGYDAKNKEIPFAQLLEKIGKIGELTAKDYWIYFTSPHPRDMSSKVFDILATYQQLAKQIHLPLQSGDDKILQKMNRQHSIQQYREVIECCKTKLPEATLFTDIIVGYCGENDTQFSNTIQAMKEYQYNMAYIAQYSPRPGAKSNKWIDDVPRSIKRERLSKATEVLKMTSYKYTKKQIGKNLKVLVTRRHPRQKQYLVGYTEGKINIRFLSENDSLIGGFVHLKITNATEFSLEGEMQR